MTRKRSRILRAAVSESILEGDTGSLIPPSPKVDRTNCERDSGSEGGSTGFLTSFAVDSPSRSVGQIEANFDGVTTVVRSIVWGTPSISTSKAADLTFCFIHRGPGIPQ